MSKIDILNQIIQTKREEIRLAQQSVSLSALTRQQGDLPNCRCFYQAMLEQISLGNNAIIAEAKKASPSKGVIREDFDISQIAKSYESGGATCLSILTDEQYFQGNLEYLKMAKAVCDLPIIRKDFIIDEYQVHQSRVAHADCILLIVAALEESRLIELTECAQAMGLDVLVEVHDLAELKIALQLDGVLLGINNRNLRTFEIRLETTLELLESIPAGQPVVTESGIHHKDDIKLMNEHGVNAFLIGEAFMRSAEPGHKLQELFS